MTLSLLSIQYERCGLSAVEQVSSQSTGLGGALTSEPSIHGAVVLSTCNRVELILSTTGISDDQLRTLVNRHLDGEPAWEVYRDQAAIQHIFQVAAGLDSMVIGEREIAGQLRRALVEAQDFKWTSPSLVIVVEEALKTSRRIARETKLAAAGRSVVSVGLEQLAISDWTSQRALLIGTGSYAGAVVSALRRRGVQEIGVHSPSGRGDEFAASHGLLHRPELREAMSCSDVLVSCRGLGEPIVTVADVQAAAPKLRLLDLSLHRDVAPEVALLPEVQLVALEDIRPALPTELTEDVALAERLITDGVAGTYTRLRARQIDPAVVGLRETIMAMVADEVRRLPQRELTRDDAAHALRRLATRLLHTPSVRARRAAETDRADAYLNAMAELYGIGVPPKLDPNTLESERCPVTDFKLDDLDPKTYLGAR